MTPSPTRPVLVAMSLLGGAIVPLEIALVRIFSFTIWHHFAFMVLSVALLGFAASGTLLRVAPSLALRPLERASVFASLFAATAFVAVVLVCHTPFDPTRAAEHPAELASLLVHYVLLLVPFTLAGLAVVTLLEGHAASAGTLYGFDLAGAGLGAVLAPTLLPWIGAEGLVLASAALAATAALVLALETTSARARLAAGVLLVLTSAGIPFAGRLADVQPGPGKALGVLLDHEMFPDTELASTEWNAIARVDVVEGAPPLVWTTAGETEPPPEAQIVIDGDAATPMVSLPADPRSLEFLDHMLSTTALQAFAPEQVLVLGSGGGVDVLAALHHGARHVDAVEINPVVVRLVTGPYAQRLDGLFTRPEVTLHNAEGRSFVRQSGARYDLIQLSLVDTWAAASSGAYSLAESYLYTVEAFDDYLEHLSDRGAFTITRWLTLPLRESLRLCTVAAEALRRRGVEHPEAHVAVLTAGRLATLIVRREPFGPDEVQAIFRVAEARDLGVLYIPGAGAIGSNPFADYFAAPSPAAFEAGYPFDISPVTDDSPFFFQFGRWSDANPLGAGWAERPADLSGRLVLLAVLAQASVLSLLLVVLPTSLPRREPPPAGTARGVTYFFLIGVAFMLLEVVLMQRFTLFLGHPLYAIAFVLAVLLVSAGAGSLYGRDRARAAPRQLFLLIALLCVALAAGLPHLFRLALAAPLPLRFVVSGLVLAPLGFLLGIPMPIAIERFAARGQERLVGWAWAGNGAGSVIGPILAALLAIDLGFTAVMVLAGGAYVGAFLAFRPWWAAPDSRVRQGEVPLERERAGARDEGASVETTDA